MSVKTTVHDIRTILAKSSMAEWPESSLLFLTVHGSHAYGLNTEESDEDFKGFCLPPKEYSIGLRNFEQIEVNQPVDMTIYTLKKFFTLAANCNPNIIEVLNTDPSDWLVCTSLAKKLIDHRNDFISQAAYHSFLGYAMSQLGRIETHQRWLRNPPTHQPTREEYGLPQNKKVQRDQLGAFAKLVETDEYEFPENVMKMFHTEKAYQNALDQWHQYQTWIKNRNPKRAKLEKESGYDLKHASHLVRLLCMGEEILKGEGVKVKRPDRDFLFAIKNSKLWSFDELMSFVEDQKSKNKKALETTKLPKEPNMDLLNDLFIEILEEFYGYAKV